MKKLALLILLFSSTVFGQINTDSLWGIWQNDEIDDSTRFRALGKMAFYTIFSNPDSALSLANLQLKEANSSGDIFNQADAFNTQGAAFYIKGEYDIAIQFFDQSLKLYKKIDDYSGVGNILNNISGVYVGLNDYDNALSYLYEGRAYFEAERYQIGLAMTYSNIGTVYVYKSEMLDSSELRDNFLDSAYYFLHKGLAISTEINYYQSKGNALSNIGVVHYYRDQLDSAYHYLYLSLEIKRASNNQEGVSEDLTYLCGIAYKEKNYSKSIEYGIEALKIGETIGSQRSVMDAAKSLYLTYKKLGDTKNALIMYEKHIESKNTVQDEDNQKEAIRQQYKLEFEKQATADSIAYAKEKEIAAVQIEKQEAQIDAKRNQQIALVGGLLLISIFALFMYNRFKITAKQKVIIEEAHDELEKKNKEILDSINYAKRIQTAILPPEKLVKEHLSNSFILYKPKDVVAGDFYWLEIQEGSVLFAAADCTGHGVPGAMVSVICNNGLKRSAREFGLTDPGKILDKTRELVIAEFEKSEEEVKDGMDIALCSLQGNTLNYAGAHNNLWIIRKGATEVEEIKADKQPIGKYADPKPFHTQSTELSKGDSFYIFSDGFADQFGGEKGKKFKAANFKKLLLSIQNESMDRQKVLIDEAFENWRGHLEQLDDVCVIGVRI